MIKCKGQRRTKMEDTPRIGKTWSQQVKVRGSLVLLMLWSLITLRQFTHSKSSGMCLLLALFTHRPLKIIKATHLWHTHFQMVLHIHADRLVAKAVQKQKLLAPILGIQADKIINVFLSFPVILQWNLESWTYLGLKNFKGMNMSRWDGAGVVSFTNKRKMTTVLIFHRVTVAVWSCKKDVES